MFKLDNDFLQSLGLGGLPVEEKNRLLQMIYERLEMNVGMRLAEKMSDQQLDEFEGFIDRNDEAGALKWLETNFPNYKDVVAEELEKLRGEVTNAAPQILAAQSGTAGAQMPPIMNEPIMPGVPQPQAMPGQPMQPQAAPMSQQPYAPQPQFTQPMQPQQPAPQPEYSQPFGPVQQSGFTPQVPQPTFNPNPMPTQPQPPVPDFTPQVPPQMPPYQPPAPTQQPGFGTMPDPAQQPPQFTPPPGFTPGQ